MSKRGIIVGFLCLIILGVVFILLHRDSVTLTENNSVIPFAFIERVDPIFPDNICNIVNFGAISDGKTLNTQSFQNAVEDCAKKGGGKVYVPAGKWLTGAIKLKSNINLNLDKDAEIIFSSDPKDYLPVVFTRFEGIELYNYSPFIYALDAQNVAITGLGKLNGQGEFWQTWKKGEKPALEKLDKMVKNNVPVTERIFGTQELGLRPSFVQFVNCKNVWLEDFSIVDSPRWTIHPIYSENVWMRNLNINTLGYNSDGIVIDSSRNVLVENSVLATGDDTISIKSGLNEDGWRVNRSSENIVIRNSQINDGHSAIAIGSEMSGDVRNVFLYNLKLDGIDQGIRAKSMIGRGGIVENVWAKNISIGTAINAAFMLDLTYPASTLESGNKKLPVFRNFYLNGLVIENTKQAVKLEGLKDSLISNIDIFNIKGNAENGVLIKYGENVDLKGIEIKGMNKSLLFNISKSNKISY